MLSLSTLAAVLLAVSPVSAQPAQARPPSGGPTLRQADALAPLRSAEEKVRSKAIRQILRDRAQVVDQLLGIAGECLADPEKKEIAKDAVLLLGELRSVQAVPLLVRNLSFEVPLADIVDRVPGLQDRHPCAAALVKIGNPSLRPLVEGASGTDDRPWLHLAACVVNRILGTDLAVYYVRTEIQREQDPQKRSRLQIVEERIDRVERNWKR